MTKQVKCPLFEHWMHVVRNVWCVPALHISVGHFSGFRAVWPVSPKFSFFNSTIHLHKTWFFRCLLDNKYNKYWCHICYMCCDSKFWPCCKCHFFCRGNGLPQSLPGDSFLNSCCSPAVLSIYTRPSTAKQYWAGASSAFWGWGGQYFYEILKFSKKYVLI